MRGRRCLAGQAAPGLPVRAAVIVLREPWQAEHQRVFVAPALGEEATLVVVHARVNVPRIRKVREGEDPHGVVSVTRPAVWPTVTGDPPVELRSTPAQARFVVAWLEVDEIGQDRVAYGV